MARLLGLVIRKRMMGLPRLSRRYTKVFMDGIGQLESEKTAKVGK
jgi:hypothetical protein